MPQTSAPFCRPRPSALRARPQGSSSKSLNNNSLTRKSAAGIPHGKLDWLEPLLVTQKTKTVKPKGPPDDPPAAAGRRVREAEALRQNLLKRKAQKRARQAPDRMPDDPSG
jgi:hypothetical protein